MKYKQFVGLLARHFDCEEILPRKPGSHRLWYNPNAGMYTNIPDH